MTDVRKRLMVLPLLKKSRDYIYCICNQQEDAQEEFGWKLVHGDAFRPPRRGMLLCVLNGSGMQIFFMALITLGKDKRFSAPTPRELKGGLCTVVCLLVALSQKLCGANYFLSFCVVCLVG